MTEALDAMTFRPGCVLIGAIDNVGTVHQTLMRDLKAAFGTRFLVIARDPAAWPGYSAEMSAGDRYIYPANEIGIDTSRPERAMEESRVYEQRYGISYMRDVIQMDRRFSTGFNPATTGSTRKLAKFPDYLELVVTINACFAYYEELFAKEGVDALVLRPDHIYDAPAIWIAAKRKIPVTFASASNYKHYVTWLCGPFMERGFLEEKMRHAEPREEFLNMGDTSSLVPGASTKHFETANSLTSGPLLIKKCARSIVNELSHLLQDFRSGKLRNANRVPLIRTLAHHWSVYSISRRLLELSEAGAADIGTRPYILFLLQVEPEYSTLCLAREFSFTEAIVYQLAMCMPASMHLVVKEHIPNIGNRPPDFYDRLAKIPNVRFADFRLQGNAMAEEAVAVATISGSVGKQSTLIGKPAIIFASHVDYTHMPNIKVVRSFHDLPGIVEWAVKERSVQEFDAWKREGARLYSALVDISFDCAGVRLFGNSDASGDILPAHKERVTRVFLELCQWQAKNGVPV